MKPSRKDGFGCGIVRDFFVGLAVFLAVFTLAMLDSRASHSAPGIISKPATAPLEGLDAAGVTSGTLILQAPEGKAGALSRRAPLLDTNVNITVSGPIARATLVQKFRNNSDRRVNGVYAFPLPETANVDGLSIRIGSRLVKGRIAPRSGAGDAGITPVTKPNRLSRRGLNIFTSALTNIGPGEEITIRIDYQELLRVDAGAYSLRVPLAAAPRYTFRPNLHQVSLAGGDGPYADQAVSLKVRLESGFELDRVTSGTHEIAVRRVGDTGALIAFMQGRVPAGRDFELQWKVKGSALPETAAFLENVGGESYILAQITPPAIEAAPAPAPREVIFVIDGSGSMAGGSITRARDAVTLALTYLKAGDRFNIIASGGEFKKLFSEPFPASATSLARARGFISGLEALGGEDMLPALEAALDRKRKKGGKLTRQVLIFTDGAFSNEAELFSTMATRRGSSRVFMIGIGPAPNSFALRRAAEIGRGGFVRISSRSKLRDHMDRLFERLKRPVISDLKLEWAPGLRADVWPNPLPDLYAGEPLLVTARVSALKGNLKISGSIAGKPWKQTVALAGAKKGSGVGRFWARRKIASLEARRYSGQRASDVDRAIEAVALDQGLVSRMTRMVAVDVTPPWPDDQPLASEDLPGSLPSVQIFGKASGASAGEPFKSGLMARRDVPASSSAKTKLALNISKLETGRLSRRDTPEPSERTWILILMALAFATMTALTLGLWRHLRHSVTPRRTGRRV